MAMEGHYDSHPDGAPLILFGIPNPREKRIDYAIQIPKASSLILKHSLDAPLAGLDTVPDDEEPPVAVVFWSFRIMVGLGFAMLGIGGWSLWRRWRGTLYEARWLHRASALMGPSGFVSVLAGWITTEVGRQPEGALQERMRGHARWLGMGTLAAIGLVSVLTPFQDPVYFHRWFNLPGSIFSVIVPGAVAFSAWSLFMGLKERAEARPFLAALGLFVLSFMGVGVSFYPHIVPPSLTIWQAAAPDESLSFVLAGTVVLIPLILGYTAYAYWVFRGKVDPHGGYH